MKNKTKRTFYPCNIDCRDCEKKNCICKSDFHEFHANPINEEGKSNKKVQKEYSMPRNNPSPKRVRV